ncbi:phenolic glucoside malonyltransferase 1-like [Momordica charantia]|uniref:Phenolic glucoside malonyltransferase 1-like n=1 Tax=Momordica charantia TaxID=3673 RepID=A0A6J1DCL4_MOMCH|nr:phenolic glucoside malonyltransferase 1-like [Momordica charantia]
MRSQNKKEKRKLIRHGSLGKSIHVPRLNGDPLPLHTLKSFSRAAMVGDLRSVKIIEICRVAPPTAEDSPAPSSSLPLTFFDILWLRFHPIQRLFFYELSSTDTSFLDAIVPNLKSSLALALRHYLPLAGNLVWPKGSTGPTVEFVEGDGVLLTVAESDADFYHLSGNGFREVTQYHPLVSQLSVFNDRAAVIAIQVTSLQNRGFSIGITNHHAIMDGRTVTSFVKTWARICNLGGSSPIPTIEAMPFYDRSVIDDAAGLSAIYANVWQNLEGPNNRSLNLKLPKTPPGLIRCTLEFTRKNLQKLRQWVLKKRENNEENDHHVSSFALATAYLCVCTAKSEGLSDGKFVFAFAADARSRLKPPVPLNYFGNCLVAGFVLLERSELLGENGIVVASEAISEAIRNLGETALKGAETWCSSMAAMTSDYSQPKGIISISGSPRFEVYSADFGWGKPRKVEIASAESSSVFSLSDTPNGDGGIEIGVVRERNEMENFVALFGKGFECL